MGKSLVIAEKPSVARDIAKALRSTGQNFQTTEHGYESQDWIVTAARGHLVAEISPAEYDPRYQKWNLEDLPIIPPVTKYKPRDASAKQLLSQLGKTMARSDVAQLVNACDAGREGELIFKLIAEYCGNTKPIKRAWFSSMTSSAILEAFAHLKPDVEMLPLETAARCRSKADWLVGLNSTRAATAKAGTTLSIGRVQTPTLAMVVRRDLEIENFKPEKYYTVSGSFRSGVDVFKAKWFKKVGSGTPVEKFSKKEEADSIVKACKDHPAAIASVDVEPVKRKPPKLFDLTDLQKEANRKHGFTAARTLAAAQKCYETYKVLTYPRTDSKFLTTDMASSLHDLTVFAAQHLGLEDFLDSFEPAYKPIINDSKVTDHHAIIPTGQGSLDELDADSEKIFELVVRRFLASVSPVCSMERTTVVVNVDATTTLETFKAVGNVMKDPGWVRVYGVDDDDKDAEESQSLPVLKPSQDVDNLGIETLEHLTKAPAFFNDASILTAMASAGRTVDDEELAEAMKDSGLGTPATRSSILEKLITSDYVLRSGKHLKATFKGRALIGLLGDHLLTSPEMTGRWEKFLKDMESSSSVSSTDLGDDFIDGIVNVTKDIVSWFKTADFQKVSFRETLASCHMPGCDGDIVERKLSWGCNSYKSKDEPGCGFTVWKKQGGKTLTKQAFLKMLENPQDIWVPSKKTVASCPRCDGDIVERKLSWGCNSYKSKDEPGCGFTVWKKARDGSTRDEVELKRRIMVNEPDEAVKGPDKLMPCPYPKCKGFIVEREKSFSCNSWRPSSPGCGTTVWKTSKDGSVVATLENYQELLPAAVEFASSRKKSRSSRSKQTKK